MIEGPTRPRDNFDDEPGPGLVCAKACWVSFLGYPRTPDDVRGTRHQINNRNFTLVPTGQIQNWSLVAVMCKKGSARWMLTTTLDSNAPEMLEHHTNVRKCHFSAGILHSTMPR